MELYFNYQVRNFAHVFGVARPRLVIALGCGVLGATISAVFWSQHPEQTSDFSQVWAGARALLAGQSPYQAVGPGKTFDFPWTTPYPLPAFLVAVPFAALPLRWADPIFMGISSALLAWAIIRKSPDTLERAVLLSPLLARFADYLRWPHAAKHRLGNLDDGIHRGGVLAEPPRRRHQVFARLSNGQPLNRFAVRAEHALNRLCRTAHGDRCGDDEDAGQHQPTNNRRQSIHEPIVSNAQLLLFASFAYLACAQFSQWQPLLMAGALMPSLGFLLAAKPSIGAALWLAYPSWRSAAGVTLITCVSFALMPHWLEDWRQTLTGLTHLSAPIALPGGPLILAALWKWRVPEARLLVALACVPQSTFVYEALPLFLIAKRIEEAAYLAAATVAVTILFKSSGYAGYEAMVAGSGFWMVWLMYLPCLLMILGRRS